MEKEHKKFVLNSLYGLIEGGPDSLQKMAVQRFKICWPDITDFEIKVIESKRKFVKDLYPELEEDGFPCNYWIGAMKMTLRIKAETFTWERDWEEEYKINQAHPEEDDDWDEMGYGCRVRLEQDRKKLNLND